MCPQRSPRTSGLKWHARRLIAIGVALVAMGSVTGCSLQPASTSSSAAPQATPVPTTSTAAISRDPAATTPTNPTDPYSPQPFRYCSPGDALILGGPGC
jgi:hypothetical protein